MNCKRYLNIKGFTLVELIVVIAVLLIIATIALPTIIGLEKKAQIATDETNLKTLNSLTTYYATDKKNAGVDVFDGIDTNKGRMQELITMGYIGEEITPQQNGAEFVWNIPEQKWITSSGSIVAPPVNVAVASVALDRNTMIVSYPPNGGWNAGPKTLVATVYPENATDKKVMWSSGDASKATVDANGVVNFVSPGTVVITATTADGGKQASCTVTTQW